MDRIKGYQELINHYIKENSYTRYPKELYAPLNYMMSLGGKRMRPLLVLFGSDLFNGSIPQAVHAAMAVETFHNFTLMHDDIMDNAPLRRGNSTVHEKWGINTAILSGDVMLVEAYKLLTHYQDDVFHKIMNLFNDTAVKVCEGQQIDMNFETRTTVSIAEYITMITQKTAVLLGASLQMGAMVANATDKDGSHLYEFGKNLGIAFQLQDDYLDLYAESEKFGKQPGGDIIANKKTYLLIKAFELAEEENKTQLNFWLNAKNYKPEEKINGVKSVFDALEIHQFVKKEINSFATLAFESLNQANITNEVCKDELVQFTHDLLVRNH